MTKNTDAHKSTLLVIEAGEECGPLDGAGGCGRSLVMILGRTTKLHHAGGMNACFVDGGVRFLKANTPATVRRALMSISGDDDEAAKEW